jgi:VIT1/CCC1 family predicted Fe2+/Mn2+ transporter
MEHLAFVGVLEKLAPYGVPGIMAFLWWLSIKSLKDAYSAQDKANNKILEQYQKVLEMYKGDLAAMNGQMAQILKEMSDKYDNNARLGENFGALTQRYAERAESLERLIQVCIQCMQGATDAVLKCEGK